jgi:hypothetical protein
VSDERSASDLDIAPDGTFELIVSGTPHPGNWLPMAAATRRIQIRQIFTDWSAQEPGWYDIERLDRTTPYPAPLDGGRMAVMLGEVGRWVSTSAVYWNDYQRDLRARLTVNSLEAPRPQEGGGLSIRYGFGWWQLEPHQALVVEFTPPPARYWSLQPYTVGWFEALDYRNHQTTVNNAQAVVEPGAGGDVVRIVVSAADPGLPNWIDTCGHAEGQLILRWIWADPDAVAEQPACRVVAVDDLRPTTPVDRAAIVRSRRVSVARRHRR